MGTLSTQILVSKHLSSIKETKVPWEVVDFRAGERKTQDELGTSYGTRKKGNTWKRKMMWGRDLLKEHKNQPKGAPNCQS